MAALEKVESLLGRLLRPVRSGDDKLTGVKLHVAPLQRISVSSPAFAAGTPIPEKYSNAGQNVSPPLRWTGVPGDTAELVLICEDPDAPMPSPFVHWIMYHIPASTADLPENVLQQPDPSTPPGAKQSHNDGKTYGYFGPKPPLGHGVHNYHFQLFAIDKKLDLKADPTKSDLLAAMKAHLIAEGELVGTFERQPEK